MDDIASRFRSRNSKLQGRAWQSPEARRLRDAAMAEAKRLAREGYARSEIARRFNVATVTISRWLQSASPLREVALVTTRAAAQTILAPSRPVIVLPSGVRVEGLSAADVAALLRALE